MYLAHIKLTIPAETIPVKLIKLPYNTFLTGFGKALIVPALLMSKGTETDVTTAITYELANDL